MIWNPNKYLAHASLRERPALELLARIPLDAVSLAYDMGCGTGNSTRLLKERWINAKIIGVDNSDTMLQKARESGAIATWRHADLNQYFPEEKADLIFSNAAYHWIDNHQFVFSKLIDSLTSNGVLAVQMPANFDAPSHRLLKETAANGPWSDMVADLRPSHPVHTASEYYDMLNESCKSLNIWYTEYQQLLTGNDPVFDWMKGTTLVPYMEALTGDLLDNFLELYRVELKKAYPKRSDGKTLFPFKRLFIIAQK